MSNSFKGYDFLRIVYLLECNLIVVGLSQLHKDYAAFFGFRHPEGCSHLFFTFYLSYKVWIYIYDWLGFSVALPNDASQHFVQHVRCLRGRCLRKFRFLIWHAVCWCLWLMRNRIVFQSVSFDTTMVLAQINALSWSWFINKGVERSVK